MPRTIPAIACVMLVFPSLSFGQEKATSIQGHIELNSRGTGFNIELAGGGEAYERRQKVQAQQGRASASKKQQRKIQQVPIQLETKTGKLDGTLDLPEGKGPFPVVIIHVGSGPTDRDGNQRPHLILDCNKRLGQALAQRGIAVLRYDRRGLGKSAAAWSGKEEDFRFDILVDDLVDWVKMLRKDRRFSRVGIMGHSQGSLVGILAAQKVKVDAFVSLAGVGRKTHEALIEQYSKNLPALIGVAQAKPLEKQAQRILSELAGKTAVVVKESTCVRLRP